MNKKFTAKLIAGLMSALALTSLSFNANAEADPKLWPVVKEAFFAGRTIEENAPFIRLTAPRRAESGAQVPFTINIDRTVGEADAIKKLYILVDANPIPLTATYTLTEALGQFELATRIRMETDSFVRAIGETADGKLFMTKIEIRAAGGCGGMVDGDEAAIRAASGKVKMNFAEGAKIGTPVATTFIVKHPMYTGLQRDPSGGYKPAFFMEKADFTYNGQPVMQVHFGVGTAEDPYLRFNFTPKEPGSMEVKLKDNEGKTFEHKVDLNT